MALSAFGTIKIDKDIVRSTQQEIKKVKAILDKLESEQRHMDSVANLIYKYQLDDTVMNNGPGIFTNEAIQVKYDSLLANGNSNLTSALEVGVEIEEMDIEDIKGMLKDTDKVDIEQVLPNLLNGSNNHLDAFNTQLGLIPQ